MSQVFYTSDLHLRHHLVSKLRGYSTSEEHDQDLLARWNKRVSQEDAVWILGDVTLGGIGKVAPLLEQMQGKKHLVIGNHDRIHPLFKRSWTQQKQYAAVFETIHLYAQHNINGTKYLLSHFPYASEAPAEDNYAQWRLPDMGERLLCGHVHSSWVTRPRTLNVGLDYFPHLISASEVDAYYRKEEL